MALPGPLPASSRAPIPIDSRAADHLRYIRETMERAGEFTAVPGWGGVAMGLTALVAALFASRQLTPERWLNIWLIEAFAAIAIAAPAAATKAHRANAKLLSGPGRKFLLSFAPPIVVGGLLTYALAHAGLHALLPGVWLLLYGTAIVTGGAFSVRWFRTWAVPDAAGSAGAFRTAEHWRLVYGGRIWICADWIRDVDRAAVRG